jgi:uncharacterized membrane protein SpoIIM required for sporulation
MASNNQWHMVSTVVRRELRDASRDWRIIIPILLLTLGFPFLMNFTAQRLVGFASRYGAALVANQLIPFLLLVVGFFPTSFSLVIALETFVGEKERKSLEPLLATPLTNRQLYLGKMVAALVPPLLASYLGMGFYLLGLRLTVGWVPTVTLLAQTLLLTTLQGVIMVAAAVVMSSQTTSVRAANLLASFIIVPMALLIQAEAAALFWGNHAGLWWLIVGLGLTAVTLIRMGVHIFNREELLGRDIDQIRLGWLWRQLWQGFTGRENGRFPSPITWYRQTLLLLPSLRLPALATAVAIVGGLLLGGYLGQQYALPPNLQAHFLAAGDFSAVPMLAPDSAFAWAWTNNLRLILLQMVLGVFTLGVLGLLVFGVPWVILGYWLMQVWLAGGNVLTAVFSLSPHGTIELLAFLIAGAAALRWHVIFIAPLQQQTISERFVTAAVAFFRLLLGVVLPLLWLAALIETTLS